ncbi:hypothetical protein TNIN_226281 [Trichonephila inaurata madagascariensis]|uniref:Uncharacterized protein n=1 Tax=Trichonephila inaurata madagascariensis TaxID=2747483 RepID=A0A8X6XY09_9ARAC|nr:hypothetical protein TNIN_226281 [Trichonephila inaurata madagascariensis]
MWFQLALYPDAPLLGVLVGSDNFLYFRIMDLANLLGRKNGSIFAKRYPYDIVFGKDVLPLTQKYPRYTAKAHLSPETQPIVSYYVKVLNWPNDFQTPSILAMPTCKVSEPLN